MADRNYGTVKQADKFEIFVDRLLEQGKPIGFDIESGYIGKDKDGAALMTHHPEWIMVGFSFTNSTEWARYVPIAHDSGDNVDDVKRTAKALWRMLHAKTGVAHNAHYELSGLSRWFMETLGDDPEVGEAVMRAQGLFPILSDSMLEAYMTAQYQYIGLKPLTLEVFGHKMVEFMDLFPEEDSDLGPATPKSKRKYVRFNTRNLVPIVVNYACEDAVWCLALHEKHYPELEKDLMTRTENALLPVLVEMEYEGLYLDWKKIENDLKEALAFKDLMNEEILADLSERLGEVVNINLGSVPQLANILFERLGLPVKERSEKTNNPSTSSGALQAIAKKDPVIQRILEYREVVKLCGSYLKKYHTELNYAGNGRAYPNHKQDGAKTGRLAVDGVSYQQWPKPYHYELKSGKEFNLNFRDYLISPPEYRIVGYDFSQVELRVLAGVSNETAMLKAFADGTDIHKATAASMFGIPVSEVTKDLRSKGKTGNFAVVYGSGAQNMADMMGTTKEEAQALLDAYYAGFPNLRRWMDEKIAEGRQQGFVHTLFGRKFTVWEYQDSRDWMRSKGDRMCVNAPIQGGAADYMKIGMVRVHKAIKNAEASGLIPKGGIRLFMTVHDALEFYVHDSVATQTVIDLVTPAVSFPVKGLPEIRTDWHEGDSWGSVVELKLDQNKKIIGYALDDVDEEFTSLEAAKVYMANERAEKAAKLAAKEAEAALSKSSVDTEFTKLVKAEDAKNPPTTVESEMATFFPDNPREPESKKKNSTSLLGGDGSDLMDLTPDTNPDAGKRGRAFKENPPPKKYVPKTDPEPPVVVDEDEPTWRHSPEWHAARDTEQAAVLATNRITIEASDMPDEAQWEKFKAYIASKPGHDSLTIVFPEGPMKLDSKHALTAADQPQLSLILGGASLQIVPDDVDSEELLAGLAL